MRLLLENGTRYRTEEVRDLIAWVFAGRPLPKRIVVRPYREQYAGISALTSPNGATVRISLPGVYPQDHRYPDLEGAPAYTTYDWREELVVDAAHEAVHVARPGKLAYHPRTELAAELHAVAELRRYRIEHPLRAAWVRLRSW